MAQQNLCPPSHVLTSSMSSLSWPYFPHVFPLMSQHSIYLSSNSRTSHMYFLSWLHLPHILPPMTPHPSCLHLPNLHLVFHLMLPYPSCHPLVVPPSSCPISDVPPFLISSFSCPHILHVFPLMSPHPRLPVLSLLCPHIPHVFFLMAPHPSGPPSHGFTSLM